MDPLVLEGVVKTYPGFRLDLDLRAPRGLVTGLVGANGAGKTTALKIALGLVHPEAGSVSVVDHERLGVVLDQPPYVPGWTVATTGRVLGRFYPTWDAERFRALTEGTGIPGDKQVGTLSRGMGMRLQLAAALAHDTELLLLDEPTSGLDPLARDELLDALAEVMLDETRSVLLSTHITADLDRIADHLVVLSRGRVVASGPKDDVLDAYRMVAGGPGDLPATRGDLIGLRVHAAGWDALARAEHAESLAGVRLERPTIDDLVIRTAKEDSRA